MDIFDQAAEVKADIFDEAAASTSTATTPAADSAGPDGLSRNLTPEQRAIMAQPGGGTMTYPKDAPFVADRPEDTERMKAWVNEGLPFHKLAASAQTVQDAFDVLKAMQERSGRTMQERLEGPATPPSTPAKVTAGAVAAGLTIPETMTSPLGIATLGAGAAGPTAARVVSGAFGVKMTSDLPEQVVDVYEAFKLELGPEEATKRIGALTLNTAMIAATAKHAATAPKPVVEATDFVKPGDLLPQPIVREVAPLEVAAVKAEAAGAPATAEAVRAQAIETKVAEPLIPSPEIKGSESLVEKSSALSKSDATLVDNNGKLGYRINKDGVLPNGESVKVGDIAPPEFFEPKPAVPEKGIAASARAKLAGESAGSERGAVTASVVEAGEQPSSEVVRKNRDFNILNRANSGQWSFYFERLGEAAKSAWDRMALGEFKMRENTQRDIKLMVEDTASQLPKDMRKQGAKAFFDVVNGKSMEQIREEWGSRPNGEAVVAQAEKVKGRLEEIRTTIREIKRDSYEKYLGSIEESTLAELYRNNTPSATARNASEMVSELSRLEFPDNWGIADGTYLPHMFFGNWKVTATVPGRDGAAFVMRAKTPAEAKTRIYNLTRHNPEYVGAEFKIEQDTIIPADMIRLGDRRFWNLIQKIKDQGAQEVDAKDAVRGIIGRKAGKQKWFGSLQERKGAEGYSKDYEQVMTAYLHGFNRWKELTAINREVQPLIEQVRKEGRLNAEARLNDILDNLWGKPTRLTMEFDALIRDIPVVRDYVKPMALDRWARFVNSTVSNLTLRTVRFGVINRLQPLQGLYPLIGEKLMVQAKILQHSRRGRDLLEEGGVELDAGQYAGETSTRNKVSKFVERISGERSNQEIAFLGMYLHGTQRGLPHAEAVNYAKLRGQLMTQFTPLVVDTPPLLEGPIGKVIFQYKRFPIKQVELLARMGADRNAPGLARWLGVMAATGGLAYMMRQTYMDNDKKLKAKKILDEQFGELGGDAVFYGLPGLVGADISGSLVLGDEPFGANLYEKAGRQLTGPGPSLTYETLKAAMTEKREPEGGSKAIAMLRKIPSLRPIAEVFQIADGEVDITTPDGETKYRRTIKDALMGLGSFKSANEANIQTAVSGVIEIEKEKRRIKNRIYAEEGSDESIKAVDDFNNRWPEMAITGREIRNYLDYRKKNSEKTDAERVTGKKGGQLLPEGAR